MNSINESEKRTMDLALYQLIVKHVVLAEVKIKISFSTFNLQYLYMEGFTLIEAALKIVAEVRGITDVQELFELNKRLETLKVDVADMLTPKLNKETPVAKDIKNASSIKLTSMAKLCIANLIDQMGESPQALELDEIIKELSLHTEIRTMDKIIMGVPMAELDESKMPDLITYLEDFEDALDRSRRLHKVTNELLEACRDPAHTNIKPAYDRFVAHRNSLD